MSMVKFEGRFELTVSASEVIRIVLALIAKVIFDNLCQC